MNDPKIITIGVLIISFFLFLCFFYLIKPKVVQKLDSKGKLVINWGVLITLSLSISIGISTGTLLYLTYKREISGELYMGDKHEFIPESDQEN